MERMVMSDIEGKALRGRVSKLGSEGISITNEEVRQYALSGVVVDLVSR
jgi:hypothetical protein